MTPRYDIRRDIKRRAVDRPAWNEVYEDLPDKGDRPYKIPEGARRLQVDLDLPPHLEVLGYHVVCKECLGGLMQPKHAPFQVCGLGPEGQCRCLAVIRGQRQVHMLTRAVTAIQLHCQVKPES